MRSSNTFGVHFTLRNKEQNGKPPIYARIVVNKTRCELSLKHYLPKNDWNEIKGVVKSKNEDITDDKNNVAGTRVILKMH